MPEQATKSVVSRSSTDAADAGTGSYPIHSGGKVGPTGGNALPKSHADNLDLHRLVGKLNVASRAIGHDLRFEVDLKNGPAVIQVLDRETGEVIRQIPSEKASLMIRQNGALQIRLLDALV